MATITDQEKPAAEAPQFPELPEDAIIVVPVRNFVLFPDVVMPLSINRPISVAAAQAAVQGSRPIGVLTQRDAGIDTPTGNDMHRMGTLANVLRYVTADEAHHLIVQGESRFRVVEFLDGWPFLVARIEQVAEVDPKTPEIEARMINLRKQALETVALLPQAPQGLSEAIQNIPTASTLADTVAAYIDIDPAQKQELLATIALDVRLEKISRHLEQRLQVLRLSAEIGKDVQETLSERQREHILREQMAAIQRQLGEDDGKSAEIAELTEKIAKAAMPPEVEKEATKELRRLERMPEGAAEHGIIRTYLDWLTELPWAMPEAETEIDISQAREILDEDHYGLDKIKRRIIEYLAVRKLAPEGKAPILCFAGPPGVGKTSLGQSIARAMGRPFTRVSLGGVHDEAEIRGHRRTYIGAMPGNIIQAIRKAGTRDCVMMLDEIDKMGRGIQGDPSAAMLEVLDPEQNGTFRDNYLGVPFDLSRVVFIATANMLDTIPGPLRDRMEIITLAGYTEEEKLAIARRYLVKRQLDANGVSADQVEIDDAALAAIIEYYTREAGVRNLEREIGKTIRHAAVQIAEGSKTHVSITEADLNETLGGRIFEDEVAQRTSVPGVATGMAWTPVGGDILFIEATRMPGGGRMTLTGQLGDVMRESAQAAWSLLRSRAETMGIDAEAFEKHDVHVHVPAGATPKDGPSAGVAMFMALSSLFLGRTVRSDTSMTGEISLRGLVLPVGGIKEKVVAAAGAGIKRVMLPARNKRDYDDIPASTREKLEFIWLEKVEDALEAGLDPEPIPEGEHHQS
jgi:ATP-dependent Lon protease